MNICYRKDEIELSMKLFDKIREKMCMSKTSAVIGFRVTLRLVSLYLQINHRLSSWRLLKQTHRSDPTLRKGICCSSLEDLRKKIANKFPHHAQHTLPLFTDDGTEVKEALLTFQRTQKAVTHINTGGWWWLPDEPGSTKPAGGWESPSYISNSWKHLWSPPHITQGEQWRLFSL